MKKKMLANKLSAIVLSSVMICSTGTMIYAEDIAEQPAVTENGEKEENVLPDNNILQPDNSGDVAEDIVQADDASMSEADKVEDKTAADAIENPTESAISDTVTPLTINYQVGVQSRIAGTECSIANVTGGGMNVTAETGTDITATDVLGYEFLGWYEDYTSDNNGVLISGDKRIHYTPQKDTVLTAVYKAVSNQKFYLNMNGQGYQVNNSATQNSIFKRAYAAGTEITVRFVSKKRNFLYWKNCAGKILSREKEYTFILGSDTSISAVSLEKKEDTTENDTAFVVFLSAYQQVMAARTYKATEDIVYPDAPYKMGYEFNGWDKNEDEIKEEIYKSDQVMVTATYKPKENSKYSVTVNYEGIDHPEDTYLLQAGDSKLVTAKEVIGEKKFQYWKKGEEIISYQPSVTIWGVDDITIAAVYGDDSSESQTTVQITGKTAEKIANKYKMAFIQNFALGDKDTIVKTGFVYTTDASYATDKALMLGKSGIKEGISNLTTREGAYSYTLKTSYSDKVVYIRAFIQYRDENGTVQTLYTAIESGSYDSISENGKSE